MRRKYKDISLHFQISPQLLWNIRHELVFFFANILNNAEYSLSLSRQINILLL